MIHELKIKQKYLEEIVQNIKTFEVRFNDRNFKINDILILKSISTNDYLLCEVIYILNDNNYCKDGYVIMSIKVITYNVDNLLLV